MYVAHTALLSQIHLKRVLLNLYMFVGMVQLPEVPLGKLFKGPNLLTDDSWLAMLSCLTVLFMDVSF